MGKQGNCIYIDAEKKWWIAETENISEDGEIILIEEKTEELKKSFIENFVEFIDAIAPHVLYRENDQWCGSNAKNIKIIHQN